MEGVLLAGVACSVALDHPSRLHHALFSHLRRGRPSTLRAPPSPAASGGSFGRAGGIGNPVSNRFQGSTGEGGSFGRSGTAGARTFSSIGRHSPPAPASNIGQPVTSTYNHPYFYGGRPHERLFHRRLYGLLVRLLPAPILRVVSLVARLLLQSTDLCWGTICEWRL